MGETAREQGHGCCRLPARPPLPEKEYRDKNTGNDKRGDDEAGIPRIAHGAPLLQCRYQKDNSTKKQRRAEDVGLPEEASRADHKAAFGRFFRDLVKVARESIGQGKQEEDNSDGTNRKTAVDG